MGQRNIDDVIVFSENIAEFDESLTPTERCVSGQPLQRTWHQFTSGDEKFFVGTWEAEPGAWTVNYTENEYCHILSGHSILRDSSGAERQIRAGDDLVIPAGFRGIWEVRQTTRKIYVIYQP